MPLWSRRAAPGKAQSSSGSKLVSPEPFAPATNVIVGRFNGTTGLTKECVFVAAGKKLFQPLSFESQPSPGRLGHLLSDREPLSMIYNPVVYNDTPIRIVGKHAGGPPFQKRPG